MRKKSFTTKCRVDEDNVPEPCRSVNEEASHSDADSDVVQITPLFLMDSSGHPVLQDGTPVVEPEVVIDSVSDENSANSRNTSRIPSSFSPGVMDCVKCTACCYKIQPFTMPFSVHPLLKVLLCNRCTKYCEKQDFAKDESGKDENCKWCSDGGDLVCCDNCSHAICKKCIRQNLGRTYLRNIESLGESDTWNCFVCDPTPIKALQDNCSEIVNKVAEYEAIKRRRSMRSQESRRSRNKSQVSEPTVGDVFNSSSSPMNFMIPNTVEMPKPTTLPIPDIHYTNVVNPKPIIKIIKVNTPTVVINPAPLTSESIDLLSIFNQISSVNETNVKTALRASQKCLDIFLKDIRRLENNLMRNPPLMQLSQVAQSFQSIYKFHLFTRLGNLSARMLEEEELINKTSRNTIINNNNSNNNNNNKQTISFHPVPILPKVSTIPISVPIPTNSMSMTIDLTNEDSPLKSNTSESEALLVSSELIRTQQTTPTVTNDIDNIKSNSNNNNSYKRRLCESESEEKLECGKKLKLGLITESDTVKREDGLCKEKKPSEEEDLERELHNLERICTKAINSSLLEQSQSSTIEKQHDESIENLKHDKKNTENTTENENTVNRRITRRSCKTTDTKTDEFEDDSWSIEENIINSSFQNNSNNNINPDSTFDGSEANDPLVSGENDTQILLQDQLERKTNDYLHNLNARDALLKSSSDDDDDSSGEGGNDDHAVDDGDDNDVRDDEKVADNLIKRKKLTPDAINGNSANDNNITEDVTHSSDSNTSQKETPSCADVEKSLESSDPFVRLTRLTNAAVNEKLENHNNNKKANKVHHSSLLDDDDDDDEGEDNKNNDNHDVDLDKYSQSTISLSNSKTSKKPNRRTRRVLSSSESNGDDDDDDDNGEESEQSTSNESHNSKQLKSRHKVKSNKLTTLRITRSQKQLPSGKSKVLRSDDDDNGGGGGGGNEDAEDEDNDDEEEEEGDGEKEKKRKQKETKKKKKADADSPTDETVTKKRQQKSYRKRKLRRVHLANSDESGDNNNSEEDDNDDDDANLKKAKEDKDKAEKRGEEETDEGLDSKGRKKIRRIYTTNKLSEATKAAQANEEERRRRIAERQKMYNEFVVQDGEGINTVTTKLILDPGDPIIEVHPGILKHLKPHQVEAVRFLWDCTIESVEHQKSCNNESSSSTTGNGAILAHCMGLGKTLSIISFLHTLLRYPEQLNIRTCLIICPVNTLLNWKHEWDIWLPEDEPVDVFELASKGSSRFKLDILNNWHKNGGVLIIGYDMFRNFVMTLMKRSRSKYVKTTISTGLLNPGPDIVVCDEGHLMKNAKTHISKAVTQIRTTKRVILTGTPLQNNLNEYHAMVDFVKPNLLGTLKEFNNRFVNPIKNGQHSNSTPRDVNIMKKRAHILYKTLDGCVQRRDYSVLTKYLPPRHEYVIMCRLTKVQQELYAYYLENFNDLDITNNNRDDTHRRKTLFTVQQTLYRISTHPYALRIHETKEARKMLLMSEDSFIDDSADSLESSTSSNSAPSDTSEEEDDDDDVVVDADADDAVNNPIGKKKKTKIDQTGDNVDQKNKENNNTVNKKSRSRRRRPLTRQEAKNPTTVILDSDSNHDDEDDDGDSDSVTDIDGSQKLWWYQFYKDEYDWQINVGAKMDVLFNILKRCSDIGDKVIMFSHSLISLDLIEKFLAEINRQWSVLQNQSSDQKTDENVENADTLNRPDLSAYFSDIGHNTWIRGLDYERMDGSMNVNVRKDLQARFNSTTNTRLRLFIISTKAGGLGINLIAANRLVLLDASWNPSHDIQSIFRSYRFGQHKPVYIYRLIAQGTIEEKIYDRQVTKQSLSLRVIDELQIDRHFSDDDLQKLFTFEPDIWNPEDNDDKRPTPILPKDRLLADLLTEYRHLIATYHNHDSLLQHREDEGLTEVERQEAWREYEEEKQYGMSLAEHQRLVMLQQQWIAQQQQQIQQQQQLFHLQYLQQQQQHQLQQHQLQHFILPNFQFPIVSSPNTSGQTIVISDDNSNNSNNNDSQVIITSPPPVLHSGNVVPNKNTKKNKNNNINNTAVTNLTTGSPIITTMTTTASATDVHHSAGSQLIADISTITNNFGNSSNSSASIAVQPSRMQQARYITPAINNLPSNAYGRMYSQVRRGAILKDPSLISDPEKLDKLTMNKLVSVLTTPVLVNTDDVQDLNSFAMRSKTTSHPQSKN